MQAYACISLYLWICLGALQLYGNAVLRDQQLPLLPLGTAAIKALILGKFILVIQAVKIVEQVKPSVLVYRILWKSLGTLLLLLLCTLAEDIVIGLWHGQALADTLNELVHRSWAKRLASSFVMWLVLIPMIAFEELDAELGRGNLLRMLLGRPRNEQQGTE